MGSPYPLAQSCSEWGGSGSRLLFAHANGFPPGTYRRLLDELSGSFRVATFAARPLWPDRDPSGIQSWFDLAADFRQAVEDNELDGALAVGHSLGGVLAILAQSASPGLFRGLALIDPVVFTGLRSMFWGALKGLGFGQRLPLIRGAQRRRDRFPDREAVRRAYGRKQVFSTWEPAVLDDYIRAGFREVDGAVELRYSKAWEARIFELTPASVWAQLRRIEMPLLFIRGGRSDTFLAAASRRARRQLPAAEVVELPELSHFLPMEDPATVAGVIASWSERVSLSE